MLHGRLPPHARKPRPVESRRFGTRRVPVLRPLGWLAAGWRDFMRCLLPGVLHGPALALFGGTLFWLARDQFWLLSGAFSGFLLVAPVLATGLYAVSRALQREGRAWFATALAAWRPRDSRPSCSACWPSPAPAGDDLGRADHRPRTRRRCATRSSSCAW